MTDTLYATIIDIATLMENNKENQQVSTTQTKGKTMSKELVRDMWGQIHSKGCKKASGPTQALVGDDYPPFQGKTATEFAQYWTDFYNFRTFENTTVEEWLPYIKEELNSCTGIR